MKRLLLGLALTVLCLAPLPRERLFDLYTRLSDAYFSKVH